MLRAFISYVCWKWKWGWVLKKNRGEFCMLFGGWVVDEVWEHRKTGELRHQRVCVGPGQTRTGPK